MTRPKLYRTEVHDPETETLERMLNRVARQGWEVVGVMPPIPTLDGEGGHWLPEVIFKRKDDETPEPDAT